MSYTALSIVVIALVTALLRFIPFWVFSGKKEPPKYISYLGQVLPGAIMAMLVVYCLKAVNFSAAGEFVPELIASISVVLLHVWRRNTLLSIVGGTAVYMLLVQMVF